ESELLSDDLIEVCDRIEDGTNLSHFGLDSQAERLDNGGISSQSTSCGDLLEALFNQSPISASVLEIELTKSGRVGLLNSRQSGPALQEVTRLDGVQVTGPIECLRKIHFQQAGDAIGMAD